MTPHDPARTDVVMIVVTGLPGSGKTTLATRLAAAQGLVRFCPDDWMMAAGIDLWDAAARARIEGFQLDLAIELLTSGTSVVIEWGVWTRSERDALRRAAEAISVRYELHYTHAPVDELWRRICDRDLEGRWGARSITRAELDEWAMRYEPPTADEFES